MITLAPLLDALLGAGPIARTVEDEEEVTPQ